MDDNQRLHLQKMITANNVEDNTDLIRELKHSHILRDDINNLISMFEHIASVRATAKYLSVRIVLPS